MKVAIVGSREYLKKDKIYSFLNNLKIEDEGLSLISGGARGVDSIAFDWAIKNNINIEIIRPINPKKKIDYLFRNVEIITKCDYVVAFWDGISNGTAFVIEYATSRKKEL